jgi:hypothetical protein
LPLVAAVGAWPFIDECGDATSCSSCLAPSHGGGNCGWCAPTAVEYADGTTGKRCADLRDKSHGGGWQCSGKLMTDQCLPGWVCGGAATKYQCVPSATKGEGNPKYSDCQASCTPRPSFKCTDKSKGQCAACADPLDPTCTKNYTACNDGCIESSLFKCNVNGTCDKCDSPSPECVSQAACSTTCSAMYGCVFPSSVDEKPKCKVGCDPKDQDCKYHSAADCTKGCDWQYKCDLHAVGGPKCSKTKYGIPKKEWCDEQCSATYSCDEAAKTCNITAGGGGQFKNKTSCDEQCPTKPTPIVPQELIGVWRGLEIHNGFDRGEWTANVTLHHFELFAPDLSVYLSGNASHRPVTHASGGETGELWVNSTSGVLTGLIKMIYGDSQLDPELGYVTLGVSEAIPDVPIVSYDKGMTTTTDKVFGLAKCASGQTADPNCKFHLPKKPVPIEVEVTGEVEARTFDVDAAFSAPVAAARSATRAAVSAGNPFATDVCNQFSSCSTCVGATVGSVACGWCTTKVQYNDSSPPKYQCSGSKSGTASGWTCYGVYRTLSCYDYACDPVGKTCKQVAPGTGGPAYPSKAACDKECTVPTPWEKCSFDGIYRGIQIDLNYPKGEWDADFVQYSKYTTANFTFVPSGYKYGGTVLCRNKADPSKISTDGDFKLSLSNGTVLYGIYHQGGNQAETEGLTWGLSNFNVTVPPESFKSAMPGLNASVYGYTKCASYKKGVCKF